MPDDYETSSDTCDTSCDVDTPTDTSDTSSDVDTSSDCSDTSTDLSDDGDLCDDGSDELPEDDNDSTDTTDIPEDTSEETSDDLEISNDTSELSDNGDLSEDGSNELPDGDNASTETTDVPEDTSEEMSNDTKITDGTSELLEDGNLGDDGSIDLPESNGEYDTNIFDRNGNLKIMNSEEYLSLTPKQQELFEQKYNSLSQDEREKYDSQYARADFDNYNQHVAQGDYEKDSNIERDLKDIINGEYHKNNDLDDIVSEYASRAMASALGTEMGLDPITKANIVNQAGEIGRIYGASAMRTITNTAYLQSGPHIPTPIIHMDEYGNKIVDCGTETVDGILIDTNNEGFIHNIDCRNADLVGGTHPITGVPFENRQIQVGNDIYNVVSPKFEAKYDLTLPDEMRQATDREQFTFCNRQLEDEIAKNPELELQFSDDQISQILSGETPDGYTWHHDSYIGHMQLVDLKTHQLTGHTGGRFIWGGGTQSR